MHASVESVTSAYSQVFHNGKIWHVGQNKDTGKWDIYDNQNRLPVVINCESFDDAIQWIEQYRRPA